MSAIAASLHNWSGNYVYRARELHHPRTLDELRTLAVDARSLHALGSRHSFSAMGDAEALVSCERLAEADLVAVDADAKTVTVGPAVTYADLARELNARGLALANLASLPHISVAGAIATASHGSGDRLGNLATSVRALELVTSSGELVTIGAEDPRLPGAVIHLGALGIVRRVTLAVEPHYELRQTVYEGLGWDALAERFDEVFGAGRSVSVFHDCGAAPRAVWVKAAADSEPPSSLAGARAADGSRHPLPAGDPVNCTEQLGVPGPWSERLPHFRSGFQPSRGEEIQSELFVARADAMAALRALRSIGDAIRPELLVAELRTQAEDGLWLSAQGDGPTASLHFTWRCEPAAVQAAVARVEAVLADFAPRPHWGKVSAMDARTLVARTPRLAAFAALQRELDPRGAFLNNWLRDHVLAGLG